MRFLVLGPLEVRGDEGDPLAIAGSKERTILASLIARAGSVAPVDDLIDELWGDDPPRTAEKTLGSYVSRLRRALERGSSRGGDTVISSRGGGYALELDGHDIDAISFEALAKEGRGSLDGGQAGAAAAILDDALGLWRGAAYQDVRYTRIGANEGERLEELRRAAVEDRIDARLGTGSDANLVSELEGLVREEPLRERRWAQLMLALYREDRQAEALGAYQRARDRLVEELGVDPGPTLQELHAAILRHDPSLDVAAPPIAASAKRADICPYKGLTPFETVDAGFFFGREHLVAEAIAMLVSGRFLGLVGASGSGKSSLLRAGIVWSLQQGAVPGSEHWTTLLIRPGAHPLTVLQNALGITTGADPRSVTPVEMKQGSESGDRLVLAVDQFEEVFTECSDEEERAAFLDTLTRAALDADSAVTVVVAMRADYYGRCAEHRALASLLARSQVLVGPMDRDELRRAIELPAERAGLSIETELTDALVEDTGGRPGGLPLLSTELLLLWQRRLDHGLRLQEYLRAGGVREAVARLAEDAFGQLDPDEQAAARRILLRLAEAGEGDEVVSRRARLAEFDLDRNADASRAFGILVDARIIVVAGETAEVGHEALLREWPRLRDWLEEDAYGRRLHRHLTQTAVTWDVGGRDDGELYRGARLTSVLDWAGGHDRDLNDLERDFVERSRAVAEGQARAARRTNRRLRELLAGVAVLLVLSLIVGTLALRQRDAARGATDVADARQLAANSLTEKDAFVSLLLAREAVELDDSAQTRSALLAALQGAPAAIAAMHTDGALPGDLTQWLRLSADGHIIATGGARRTVSFFDAATYQHLGVVDVGDPTTTGAFSPDGGTLAVATADRRIVAIDMRTRTSHSVEIGDRIDALLFDPADGALLTAESTRQDGYLVTRDPLTLEPSRPPARSESGPIRAMALSSDGHRVVVTGLLPQDAPGPRAYTALWDERELEPLGEPFPWGGNAVALSPDGRTAAIGAAECDCGWQVALKGRLVLLDLRTGDVTKSPQSRLHSLGPPLGLTGVAFTADGRSVISTGDDHRILVWDASSAKIEESFDDPERVDAFTPGLSPDGTTLFTIDEDGNVVAWDLTGDRRLGRSFTAGSGATYSAGSPWFAISPDGGTLAIIQITNKNGESGSIQLVDTSTMDPSQTIPFDRGSEYPGSPGFNYPEGVAFSPDGATLAVISYGGYVKLWDVRTGRAEEQQLRDPASNGVNFWVGAFSPDGSTLATGGSRDGTGVLLLWDVATGAVIGQLPEQDSPVSAVNFSPDGKLLIASTGFGDPGTGGDSIIWNIDEDRVEQTISVNDAGVAWADVSNDGTTLVTGGAAGGVRLWRIATGEPVGAEFTFSGIVDTVDLSPDGRTLVAAGRGQVTMWDVATGSVLGQSWFPGVRSKDDSLAAAFTSDGRKLFIVRETGEAWVWDVDPDSWEARACRIAGRSMTQAEWQLYLPDRPYRATCGS